MKNKLFIILILIVSNSMATITKHQKPTDLKKRFLGKLVSSVAGWFGAEVPKEVTRSLDNPLGALAVTVAPNDPNAHKFANITDAVMETGREIGGEVLRYKIGFNPNELVDNL